MTVFAFDGLARRGSGDWNIEVRHRAGGIAAKSIELDFAGRAINLEIDDADLGIPDTAVGTKIKHKRARIAFQDNQRSATLFVASSWAWKDPIVSAQVGA
jgi:hypothetical protein